MVTMAMLCRNRVATSFLLYAVYCGYVSGWRTNQKAGDVALHDYENQLHFDLQNNYSVRVIPPHNASSPVKVALQMSVIAIRELDEKTESLTIDAWLKMQWNDSRLSWNTGKYGGLKVTRLPPSFIWHPDVKLFNRVKLSELETQANVHAVVSHTGKVDWVVPSTFHSSCSINLRNFPYDVQKCVLKFGSWTLNGYQLELVLMDSRDKIEFMESSIDNNQWTILDSHAEPGLKYFACCEEPLPEIQFEIQLRRRSPYYKQTILYPTLGVVALTLATFWLPPNSSEKFLLSGINFVSLVIILAILSWKLPPAGKTVPMIVTFCGNLILIVVASILLSVISFVYGRARYNRPAPNWMRISINSIFGKILCVNSPEVFSPAINHIDVAESLELEDDLKNMPSDIERQQYYTAQWLQGLQMIDRVNFLIFLVIIAFSLAGAFTFNQE